MLHKLFRTWAWCGAAVLSIANLVQGQTGETLPVPLPAAAPRSVQAVSQGNDDELRSRIERLEKQNQELLEALRQLKMTQPPILPAAIPEGADRAVGTGGAGGAGGAGSAEKDVRAIVGEVLKERADAEAAKKKKDADDGFVVGQSMGLTGSWQNHQPWFETADKAFRVHVGGRIQPEWILGAGADKNVVAGKGGTGPLLEGFNFRRARLEADGWLWEVVDFFIEYDFANQFSSGQPFTANLVTGAVTPSRNNDFNTFGVPAPTDVWAGINYIPLLGGIRIGNFKPPIGLEHLISSRYLDFLERNTGFDIYYNRNNGFAPGFMVFNYTENQKLTWQLAATKPTNTLFGWTTGGGEWAYTGRITGLPWYEDNGRYMMHLGVGAQYISRLDEDRANFNGRWDLRNGGPNLQNLVVQTNVIGQHQEIINPEFFLNCGPLSIMAEYQAVWVNGVTSFLTQTTGAFVPVPSRNYFSHAAYVQAMYFLTGESRPYGKTALHSSGAAPTRVVPFRNFFWVPGHGGMPNPFSAGAWQVGLRYCWADLNDNGINGGIINEWTAGLNWFVNPNMKIQWNYDIGHRNIAFPGTSSGMYQGFGMRMTFDF
jgi:phosphate-selective porin OprO/OprP